MALVILDATTAAACAAATTRLAWSEALIAPFGSGNPTARLFAPDGTTLRRTLTLAPFTINATDDKAVVCGAHLADTAVSTGAPGLWTFRAGSTDIFSIDAAVSGASVVHPNGDIKTLCTPTLAGVTFTPKTSLPVGGAPDFNAVIYGDSLTDERTDLNRNLHPFFWINGIAAKGAQKLVANCGVNGDTVAQMLARVNNSYTNASPGLAGLSSLGTTYLRGFANNARAGDSWATIEADVLDLIAAILTYSERLIILSASPIGTPDSNFATSNALQTAYNVELAAIAAADPTRIKFIDDNINTRDGSGVAVAAMFTDGVHTSGQGIQQQGIDGAAALQSLFDAWGYASPLVTDAADVYPTTQQLVPNHVMAGTGGTAGTGFTGSVADEWTVAGVGGGITGTASKVAADGGDANATPWQRITPTQVTAGSLIRLSIPFDASLSATSNPIELMYQVRFNSLGAYFSVLRAYVTTSSGDATNQLDLKMGGATLTQTVTPRLAYRRTNGSSLNFPSLRIDLIASANFTGAMGSFDIRCATARQE